MSVDSIAALASGAGAEIDFATAGSSVPPFSERLQAEINAVDTKLQAAEVNLHDLASGKQTNIHHVMLSLEDARMSFQLLAQVRNKVLEAYQELLRMQV